MKGIIMKKNIINNLDCFTDVRNDDICHTELDSASQVNPLLSLRDTLPRGEGKGFTLAEVFSPCRKAKLSFGFTLAEVLITLGIIGIVAALVIPNAVSNYRKHIVETKLKQTYSILANAVSAAETEIGMPFGKWYMTTYHPDLVSPSIFFENGDALYQDFIKPYINKNVKEYDIGFWGAEYRGGPYFEPSSHFTIGKPFTLPNGCTAIIYNYQIFIITDPLSFNPKKKVKIQNGKNLFDFGPAIGICDRLCSGYFEIPHTFAPFVDCTMPNWANTRQVCRSGYTDEQMKENCAKNDPYYYARFCTQLLIENNFKFPKDYPIKF